MTETKDETKAKTETGFKGFDKDLKCRGLQFEVGKRIEHKGEIKLCATGLHYCEHPLNVFEFYPPAQSRFAQIAAEGVSADRHGDTKRVCSALTVTAELSLRSMITAAVDFVFRGAKMETIAERAKAAKGAFADEADGIASATGDQGAASATGDQGAASATGSRGAASATGSRGAASATGDQGAASATGYQGAASATGYQGAASATGSRGAASATGDQGAASAAGKEGCAVALGIGGKAKGGKGAWLTLAEWKEDEDYNWNRIAVKTVRVDGRKIKADVWYQLRKGKFVEAE